MNPLHSKTGGTPGTSGTPSVCAAFAVPGRAARGGTPGTRYESVPPVPARFTRGGTLKAAPLLAVPSVPPVPARNNKVGGDGAR